MKLSTAAPTHPQMGSRYELYGWAYLEKTRGDNQWSAPELRPCENALEQGEVSVLRVLLCHREAARDAVVANAPAPPESRHCSLEEWRSHWLLWNQNPGKCGAQG